MRINVITIFPEIFDILNVGVISKSLKNKIIKLDVRDLRKNATNKHNNIDSKPYGGGEGMVMMAEPIVKTLKQIKKKERGPVIFMSPQGEKLDQKKVKSFSKLKFPINQLAQNINNQVKESSYKGMFITAVIGKLNISSKDVEFVNFGHESIMCFDKNKKSFSYIKAERPPLYAKSKMASNHILH